MPVNALGQTTWPNPIKKAGQLVLEYEDHYLFYLKKEVFHTAGLPSEGKPAEEYSDWEKSVVVDDASPQGISLNKDLYKAACQSRREGKKDFIVYDQTEDTFYILTDHDKMLEWVSKQRGKAGH